MAPTKDQNLWRNRTHSPELLRFVLAVLFVSTVSAGVLQLRVTASRDLPFPNSPGAQLAFSENGQLLRVIGSGIVTYDAASATIVSNLPLDPNTQIFSIAGNGRTVLLGVRVSPTRMRLLLLDAATGQTQALPSDWYDSEYRGPDAAVSSDGRLLSIYSESNSSDRPMVVTVYDWLTKQRVAQQTSEYISAGGGFGGGVTTDGAVEFVNNRAGRKLVDLKSGRSLGSFGFHSLRSADGAWVIEFPDRNRNELSTKDVVTKDGRTAEVRGKLNVQIEDDETYGTVTGSFCGTTGRLVLARRRNVAMYAIPSGSLLVEFPPVSWQDRGATAEGQPRVACSLTSARVAIFSGDRLTIHDVR